MGVIIPFEQIKSAKSPLRPAPFAYPVHDHLAITAAVQAGADQLGVLMAASSVLERCRDRYGFIVMRDGLPKEPAVLGRVLLELSRGLSALDAEMGAPRTYPTFGVYFGRRQLAWFEDGYSGTTGLAVPNETNAADLAAFVRPRIAVAPSRSQN
jgi:hypothetical protein